MAKVPKSSPPPSEDQQQSLPSGKHSRSSSLDSTVLDIWKIPAHRPSDKANMARHSSAPALHQSAGSAEASEHAPDTSALSAEEAIDMAIVKGFSADSKRYRDAIAEFVNRGLSLGGKDNGFGCSALKYFHRLRQKFDHDGFEPAKVTEVHDAMIHHWRCLMIARLGSTVGNVQLLGEVIEGVAAQAESLGGLPQNDQTSLRLSHAIAGVLQPTVQTPNGPVRTLMAIQNEGARLRDFSVPGPDSFVDVEEDAIAAAIAVAAPHPPTQPEAQRTATDRPLAERFPNAQVFFRYHAMKAKAAARKEAWHQENVKAKAISEIDAEWTSLDFKAQSVWADMRARLVEDGNDRMLQPQTAAHLFKDGVAQAAWISNDFAADRHTIDARDSVVEAEPVPARVAPYNATTWKYESVQAPDRTIFFEIKTKKKIPHAQVKKACRLTASAAQISGGAEAEQVTWRQPNIFLVRFKQPKTARALANKTTKVDNQEVSLCMYPAAAPQMFIGHMSHTGTTGFRLDAVYLSISSAFPNCPFHLRKEPAGTGSVTTWLIVFQKAPNVLRFKIGIMRKDEKFRAVQFEPVIPQTACTVCNGGHSPLDCDILKAAKRKELAVKKGDSNFVAKKPSVA